MVSADTINTIFLLTRKDKDYEEILRKYFYSKYDRNEFRQFLWLQLTISKEKMIKAWNEGYFKWLYTSVVNNQIKSRTSEWHRLRRNVTIDYIDKESNSKTDDYFMFEYEFPEFDDKLKDEQQLKKEESDRKYKLIYEALEYYKSQNFKNIIFYEDLIKEYYILGKSLRQIEEESKQPGRIYIRKQTVSNNLKVIVTLIQKYIKNKAKKN